VVVKPENLLAKDRRPDHIVSRLYVIDVAPFSSNKLLQVMTVMQHIWIVLGVLFVLLNIAAGLIWVERRMLALWQDRLGPNRAGPLGILIVLADTLKLFFKEDWIPPFADKWVFIAAPAVVVATVLLSFVIVPFTPSIVVADLNVGLLFFLAMSSLGVYSIVLEAGLQIINIHC
jgi:NADH-quinone oxidoreductase subunit H